MSAPHPPLAVIDAVRTRASLPLPRLVEALRAAFAAGAQAPLRHRHRLEVEQASGTLLLMPAWQDGSGPGARYLGVKIVSVFPANARRGLPALHSSLLLCCARTGRHLAMIDGGEITDRRTAAASALAASFLARTEASTLLLVGSGHVASLLPAAHRAVRPIRRVLVWNIRRPGAERLAARLREDGFEAEVAGDLAGAAAEADIISCATLSEAPLVRGEWLRAGVHLDLVGSFTPRMREADDDAVRRSRVFVDTPAALAESGDLLGPIGSGAFRAEDVCGTLEALCRGTVPGRRHDGEITLFKSVGTALEDLAAAALVYGDHAPAGDTP